MNAAVRYTRAFLVEDLQALNDTCRHQSNTGFLVQALQQASSFHPQQMPRNRVDMPANPQKCYLANFSLVSRRVRDGMDSVEPDMIFPGWNSFPLLTAWLFPFGQSPVARHALRRLDDPFPVPCGLAGWV